MAFGVVVLDVRELGRVLESIMVPIQVSNPSADGSEDVDQCYDCGNLLVQVWVATADVADIAFEMLDIDSVEADDSGVQANIGLRQLFAKVEGSS